MDESLSSVLIIGGGQAGGTAALRLRQLKYRGRVTLIAAEDALPYERPCLSKEYLLGEISAPTAILTEAHPNERLLRSTLALGLNIALQTVCTSDGEFHYDRLLIATGARPRRLQIPGATLEGIHTLRTRQDADLIAAGFDHCASSRKPLLVAGGGWIGLEIAAAARQRGLDVILLEQGQRLCQRAAPASVAARLRALHEAQGVDLKFETQVLAFEGHSRVRKAHLSDGTTIEPGAVVVGIGAEPDLELARHAGLLVRQGIVVDAAGRSSSPHVYAAGDAAEIPCPWHARPMRFESWASANSQARTAADSILRDLGRSDLSPLHTSETPWFWSGQYGKTLRLAGSPMSATNATILRDDQEGFVEGYYSRNRLVGIAALDHARAFRDLRRDLEPIAA